MIRHRIIREYDLRWFTANPAQDSDFMAKPKKRAVVKAQPQTEENRQASEADDLTWEEFLSRRRTA
jgi:hypothetical protein